MIRNLLRVLFGIGVIGGAAAAGPAMPFVLAAATPVAIVEYRRSVRPPKSRRRTPPRTAATPARRPPVALRRLPRR
jgi:hypothetical protein